MRNTKISRLIKDCLSGDYSVQLSAIEKLRKLEACEAAPTLIDLLESENKNIQILIAEALGDLGKDDLDYTGKALINILNNPELLVRCGAIESLSKLGYKPAINDVKRILRSDPEYLVRISAIEFLTELSEIGDLEALKTLLYSLVHDENELVRSYSAWSIGILGTATLVPTLKEIFENEEYYIPRVSLLAAMYRLGDQTSLTELVTVPGI